MDRSTLCRRSLVNCRGPAPADPALGLALGSPIFPSGCEGKLGVALESLQGSIPGSGRFPWSREWQPTPVYSCLENPVDRGPWRAPVHTVHGVAKSWKCVVFLELRRVSQITTGNSGFLLCWLRKANPKAPRHAGFPRGEHRGSRHRFL